MLGIDALIAAVGSGFEGDADAAAASFTEDGEFADLPGAVPLRGPDEILSYFLAFGGRRERFEVGEVLLDGDRAAVEYAVFFRADAHAYAQRGIALLHLRDGLIAAWRGVWVETEENPG